MNEVAVRLAKTFSVNTEEEQRRVQHQKMEEQVEAYDGTGPGIVS